MGIKIILKVHKANVSTRASSSTANSLGYSFEGLHCMYLIESHQNITRGTAGRRSPALIHKWNKLTVRYAGLIPPASPSS